MTSPKLTIALIGSGLIGPRHALSIQRSPTCTLHSLTDPAPHGPTTASSLSIPHFPSISALLSSSTPLPDAALICTPNATHVSLSLELIAAGIPVLVEKPVATSIEDGKKLVKEAKERGVKLLVGHHRRFNPYLLGAKRVLDEQNLGRVIAIQGSWCLKKPTSYFNPPTEWRRNGENGGVVLINLIHEVDLLQYLLGPIILVSAIPAIKTRGYEAEEGAAIIMRFESGVVGTFILSDVVPSPWNFEAGTGENPMIPKVEKEEGAGGFYRIMGTEGSLSVPDLTGWSYEGKEGGWSEVLVKEEVEVGAGVPFDLQIEHFVRVVKGEAEPSCSGDEGLRGLVVCEAVKRAIGSGRPVGIEGFDIFEK
jgi:predicted dehydrogenase